jgi:hypothetical protein
MHKTTQVLYATHVQLYIVQYGNLVSTKHFFSFCFAKFLLGTAIL